MKPEPARDGTQAAAHLAQLLPSPAERELPESRHRQLKEYLMQEIAHENRAGAKPRRPRRRLAYIAAPLAAAGAFAVFAVTAGSGGTAGGGGAAAHGGAGPTAPTAPTTLLGRIAAVAASKPLPSVRDNQFVYVESKVSFEQDTLDASGYHSVLAPMHGRQIWLSVDGSRAGLVRESGEDTPLSASPHPSVNAPDFRYLETLPTDPAALLRKIRTETSGTDDEAFTTIGDLLREQIAPPAVTAALYKAAAMIPGVHVIDDVVDVTGRHDVAVGLDNSLATNEWLFNASTLEFTGQQTVALKAGPLGPVGAIEGTQIILTRAIVDRAGEVPGQAAG